jgi:hypothetical protein
MYSHPIKNPASPNSGGTQYVVTQVNNAGPLTLDVPNRGNTNGVSYVNTPKSEWYESRNGPREAPHRVIKREKYTDLSGFNVTVLIKVWTGDL